MIAILRHISFLVGLCVRGPGGRLGLVYFALIVGLGLATVQVAVKLIAWNADFYNALQKLDVPSAIEQIKVYFGLTAITVCLHLASTYLRKMLQIRWRHALTQAALDRWLSHKAFWHLRDRTDIGLDNPDQRIAEDCRIFVDKFTEEGLELISKIVGLVSFSAILWTLSSFPLAFSVAGFDIEIPRYMIWAAPIYVLIASIVTQWLGSPLKRLEFEHQRREADFRFALARIRENVEAVALASGEAAERRILSQRFDHIVKNWRNLANRELILGFFSRPYFQTVLTIPIFLALPAYLAGRVTFGGLMQIRSAFQNVVVTLSWFIFSYKDLALLAATASRLSHFLATCEQAGDIASGPSLSATLASGVRTRQLALSTPGGRALARVPDLDLRSGEAYWLAAPSGHGKSTLVKALAGLWRDGEGAIERSREPIFFAPQQVYFPLGSLAATLAYPSRPESFSSEDYLNALRAVGMPALWTEDDYIWLKTRHGLSGGERQRIALARIHLHKPAWAVLDEATSALDCDAEIQLLGRLREALPASGFVIISHRRPKGIGRFVTIDLTAPLAEAGGMRPGPSTDERRPCPLGA